MQVCRVFALCKFVEYLITFIMQVRRVLDHFHYASSYLHTANTEAVGVLTRNVAIKF